MSTVRVLVVDDYEPIRRFICSTLGKKPEWQVIGEAPDGLEAVRRAQELQPDLIVLDLGLPGQNGIEAARQIRNLSPRSKILFVSQESSADIVQEALGSGALGYVVKAHAASELLVAMETVLEGRQFVSGGVSGHILAGGSDSPVLAPGRQDITRSHQVEFYSDDATFVVGFSHFIETALIAGSAVIVVATESNREGLLQRLRERGVDIVAAIERGSYIALDVADTLSTFMENDVPDPVRFFGVVDDLIAAAARTTAGDPSRVAICGECASILWAQGKADAAIQVEQLCNQLAKRYKMGILCGFSLSDFYREEDKQIFQTICSEC